MDDFEKWLECLETQVLTDELKKSIIVQALIATHTEYLKGYNKEKKNLVTKIHDNLK